VIEGVVGVDVARRRPDRGDELHLVVHVPGLRRELNSPSAADDGRRGLEEDHRFVGHDALHLGGVIGVVTADAEELADGNRPGGRGEGDLHAKRKAV